MNKKGSIKPKVALDQLRSIETKISKLNEERVNINRAKESLELQEPGAFNQFDEKLSIAIEEVGELKKVWTEMNNLMEQIEELKEKQW